MRVQELRIGNYLYDESNKYFQVEQIGKDLIASDNDWIYDIKEIEPIPLTEEILLKCGFERENKKPSEKHSNYFSIYIYDYKYSFSFASFRDDWGFYHSYTDALREEDNNKFDAISFGIKHVHQLQNLYFALTNEELNIIL